MFEPLLSLWNEEDLKAFARQHPLESDDMVQRCYSARLLGKESALVLHGGGNTSVKTSYLDPWEHSKEGIAVKGSGHDLASIGPSGHPLVELAPLVKLRSLKSLNDEDMVSHLKRNMIDPSGPVPSVETLLHAFLPHKFIDHTHADAVLAVINHENGMDLAKQICGSQMVFVPYVMPGFDLAKLVADLWDKHGDEHTQGLILHHHGIFTFAKTAKESYERMIHWVNRFGSYLFEQEKKTFASIPVKPSRHIIDQNKAVTLASDIRSFLLCEGKQTLVCQRPLSVSALDLLHHPKLEVLCLKGPATPDHVIRTKQLPLILKEETIATAEGLKTAFDQYIQNYKNYFTKFNEASDKSKIMLDPYPKVIIVPKIAILALGAQIKDCEIVLDIYEHTAQIILESLSLGDYQPLGSKDIFDMEYWSLEQAKLKNQKQASEDAGLCLWISGASSGIGLATTQLFLEKGWHVSCVDLHLSKELANLKKIHKQKLLIKEANVCSKEDIQTSFTETVYAFGGIDAVISNAGAAFEASMEKLSREDLNKSMELNFYSHFHVAQEAFQWMKTQKKGSLLFNVSKSTLNPGPNFGPYTIAKSTLLSLVKQLALEWGSYGLRVNAINADRVPTNLFEDGFLEKRAAARGLSTTDYLSGNLLHQVVQAKDVAKAFYAAQGMEKTTGAIFPVDGGNAAAFPR